jgi:hypothetical protein
MEVTQQQGDRLKRAYTEIGAILLDLGVIEPPDQPRAEPAWMIVTKKQWHLLNDFRESHGGNLGSEAWARLGVEHGYDPRGLGGFFVGSSPLMASQGARRSLTSHGHRFIDRWKDDFAKKA